MVVRVGDPGRVLNVAVLDDDGIIAVDDDLAAERPRPVVSGRGLVVMVTGWSSD
jgi:hypothetical protein